jgi:hypothetical protein
MSQFHTISHNLSQPADKFLQAVVTMECRLTAIAVSLPPHMVQDKILGSLSSAYSTIITHLQLESPQRDISAMINVINAWERADLQWHDSVIATPHVNQDVYDANQGGEVAAAHLTRPPSPTLTASTLRVAGTPEKKKKKKKKKKQTSTSSVQVALEKMTLNDIEEGEYSM